MKTQTQEIKKYLNSHPDGLTSLEAIKMFGATRLSSIIYELRYRHQMNIKTEIKPVKNRYGGVSNIAVYKIGN